MGRVVLCLVLGAAALMALFIRRRRWPCPDCGWFVACDLCSSAMDEAAGRLPAETDEERERHLLAGSLDEYDRM